MASIEVTIQVRIDGQPLTGFPITRRVEAPDVETFAYEKQTDAEGAYEMLPVLQTIPARAIVAQTDREITLRLVGQADKGIVLQSGGSLIIIGANLAPDSGDPLIAANNRSGGVARLRGVVAGG